MSTICVLMSLSASAQPPTPDWIAVSNPYTQMLLDIEMKHSPENGSDEGLSQFDSEVSQPTLTDEDQQRRETEAVLPS